MARKGGTRRKRSSLMTKSVRRKGKISFRNYLAELNNGDKVALFVEPAVQKGMFHPKFSGKVGTVLSKKGSCYEVKINDFAKEKTLIVHPVHLKKL